MNKRLWSILLVLCLALSLTAPVLAAGESGYRVTYISSVNAYFTYENGGALPTAYEDSMGACTLTFNEAGQITSEIGGPGSATPNGWSCTYTYDDDGHMTEMLREQGFETQTVTEHTVNTWEDGLLVRTQAETKAVAAEGSDAPEYDIVTTDEYTYDGQVCTGFARTRVSGDTTSDITVVYENDADGHPVRMLWSSPSSGSAEESYVYDEQGRVMTHIGRAGEVETYTYAGPVQLVTSSFPEQEDGYVVTLQLMDAAGTAYWSGSFPAQGALGVDVESGCITAVHAGDLELELTYEPVTG